MKISKFVTAAAISSLFVTSVMASNDGTESKHEIRNTYQHEYSEDMISEAAEQKRERHTETHRLQKHLVDDQGGEFTLESQNRNRSQDRNQLNRDGGGFGGSTGSGHGSSGGSSKSGKGVAGRS